MLYYEITLFKGSKYLRVGHKSEHIKDWFNRTQRTSIDEIKQDNEIPRI